MPHSQSVECLNRDAGQQRPSPAPWPLPIAEPWRRRNNSVAFAGISSPQRARPGRLQRRWGEGAEGSGSQEAAEVQQLRGAKATQRNSATEASHQQQQQRAQDEPTRPARRSLPRREASAPLGALLAPGAVAAQAAAWQSAAIRTPQPASTTPPELAMDAGARAHPAADAAGARVASCGGESVSCELQQCSTAQEPAHSHVRSAEALRDSSDIHEERRSPRDSARDSARDSEARLSTTTIISPSGIPTPKQPAPAVTRTAPAESPRTPPGGYPSPPAELQAAGHLVAEQPACSFAAARERAASTGAAQSTAVTSAAPQISALGMASGATAVGNGSGGAQGQAAATAGFEPHAAASRSRGAGVRTEAAEAAGAGRGRAGGGAGGFGMAAEIGFGAGSSEPRAGCFGTKSADAASMATAVHSAAASPAAAAANAAAASRAIASNRAADVHSSAARFDAVAQRSPAAPATPPLVAEDAESRAPGRISLDWTMVGRARREQALSDEEADEADAASCSAGRGASSAFETVLVPSSLTAAHGALGLSRGITAEGLLPKAYLAAGKRRGSCLPLGLPHACAVSRVQQRVLCILVS